MFQHLFCSLFSSSFLLCVCVVVVSFSQRKGPRLASCYWPILFKHIHSIIKKKREGKRQNKRSVVLCTYMSRLLKFQDIAIEQFKKEEIKDLA